MPTRSLESPVIVRGERSAASSPLRISDALDDPREMTRRSRNADGDDGEELSNVCVTEQLTHDEKHARAMLASKGRAPCSASRAQVNIVNGLEAG